MLAKLKFALKNHKKVVDKNVPLNRLVLNRQNWLNEPVLEEMADFEEEKSHFICPRAAARISRGGSWISWEVWCKGWRRFSPR